MLARLVLGAACLAPALAIAATSSWHAYDFKTCKHWIMVGAEALWRGGEFSYGVCRFLGNSVLSC